MRHRKLGRTGLFVSELCLGTMTFGGESGMWKQMGALEQADADRLVGRSLDAGINFIDTADVYADGRSEIITGQALKSILHKEAFQGVNIAEIAKAGADTFVAGSAIFGSKDYAATLREMRARLAAP